jgi:hypothetical protein
MKTSLLFIIFVITVCFAFLAMDDRAESFNIREVTAGSVKQIRPHSIKILDDFNGGEVRVEIDPYTQYDNMQKLADLEEGDNVQVEYKTVHNKNTAITITKVPMGSEDTL